MNDSIAKNLSKISFLPDLRQPNPLTKAVNLLSLTRFYDLITYYNLHMKRILATTDLSDNALNALVYAFDLAKKSGAKLGIFMSFNEHYTQEGKYTDLIDEALESADTALKAHVAKITANNGYDDVEITLHTLPGEFIAALKEMVEISKPELLVMGTKGASGLKEVWVGSNTMKAIERIKVSTLVVPAEATFKPIENIVFMSDLKPVENDDALDALLTLAKISDAEVRIVNVKPEDEHSNWEERLERSRIQHILGESVKQDYRKINNSDVLKGLEGYIAKKGNVDVIAIVTRKKNLFDKLFKPEYTKELAFRSMIPLLVMHDQK
jgi:nucleotide-binding universal stress UspA family protein